MKQFKKDSKNMIVLGVGLGVGSAAIANAGGNVAGVSAMSSKMGMMGNLAGTGAVLRTMKKLKVK